MHRRFFVLFIFLLVAVPGALFVLSKSHTGSVPPGIPTTSPVPTSTTQGDFSAILIVGPAGSSISVENSRKESVGQSFTQGGIRPPTLPTTTPSPMKTGEEFLYQKVPAETYTATITVPVATTVTFYLYNYQGTVSMQNFPLASGTASFDIQYDPAKASSVVRR